jgi:Tol biopolymer transport system component
MSKSYTICQYAIVVIFLYGCSIDNSRPTFVMNSVPTESENSSGTSTKIPVTWGSLNLSGRLVYIHSDIASSKRLSLQMSILTLDLKTGDITTVFQAPDGALIGYASVSPDSQQLIMSYSLPQHNAASTSFGRQALYMLPLGAPKPPQLLFAPQSDQDEYYQPQWSPDGKFVYFTHVNYQSSTTYEVMRMAYPNGKPESLMDRAYWPRISGDGARLVYVSVDPKMGTNELFVANADGTNASRIPLLGISWASRIIDTPLFLRDNQTVLFSAAEPQRSSAPSWIDRLTGVRVAFAHGSIPSDWWSVPMLGGEPKQLTHIYALGLFGSLSPDNEYIASYSVDGIFVMQPDGGNLTKVVNHTGLVSGTVSWIP